MRIIERFFRNIGIFFVAIVFAFAILFLVKHPNLLQASVLNAGEISLIQKNKRDIAYKQSEGLLDIFFSESLHFSPVTLVLAHSPAVSFDWSTFSGQCDFTLLDANQETTTLTITCDTFDAQESILLIPFVGKTEDILLEEWYYTDDQTKHSLSIGNLTSSTNHSK